MPKYDVTAIGETMLRLSVPAGARMRAARQFDVHVGGAESNVLAALAQLGMCCGYGGALLDAPPGHMIADALYAMGIDVDPVVWMQDGRIGTYYAEYAVPPRPIQVTYDRQNACAALLTSASVQWDAILDTRLIHTTGITVALSSSCHQIAQDIITRASASDVLFSFDVNYRSKLWPPEEAARQLLPIMQQADIVFCKRQDAATLFNIHGEPINILRELHTLTDAECVVCTDGANGAYALHNGEMVHRASLPVQILDRMGAGDALAGGVLYGYLQDDIEKGLAYGVALAALALSQYGDMVMTSQAEVESLLQAAGRNHSDPAR